MTATAMRGESFWGQDAFKSRDWCRGTTSPLCAQSSFPPRKMQTWCTSHNLVCDTFPLTSCYSQRDENEVYVPTELKGPNLTGKNAAKAHARQIKA